MTMGGDGPEVLVTLTADIGRMLNALHSTKIKGSSNLSTALQIAQVWRLNSEAGSIVGLTCITAGIETSFEQGSAAEDHCVRVLPDIGR